MKNQGATGEQAPGKTALWDLFWSFVKIGALTFGGGYAMLPMLERECTEKHKWVTKDELLNYFAVGQCTPGVIAVNTATFIGSSERGVPGAVMATLGVTLPSVVIILVIASLLKNFAHIPAVQHAFAGIRVAVGALILKAVIGLVRSGVKDWLGIVLSIVAFVLIAVFKLSPIFVVVGAALVGIGSSELRARRGRKQL